MDCTDEMKEIITKANEKTPEDSLTIGQKVKKLYNVYTSRKFYKPFTIVVTLFCLYAFSGFSLINFYLITIFKEAGSSIGKLN